MNGSESRRWVAVNISSLLDKLDFINFRKALRKSRYFLHARRYRKLLQKNRALENLHSGKKFLIMGTGVSLLEFDFTKPGNCITFACNEIFQHSDADGFDLDYYVVGEPYYGKMLGKAYREDVFKFYREVEEFFSGKNTSHIYHATLSGFFDETGILKESEFFFYVSRSRILEASEQKHDLSAPITFTDGAIYVMLASAMFMGAREIYLLGCGYTYSPLQLLHFYDAEFQQDELAQADQAEFLGKLENKYPDYFVRQYVRKKGRQYYNILKQPEEQSYQRYSIIKKYAEGLGIKIINVVPDDFASPVFDSLTYSEFRNVSAAW